MSRYPAPLVAATVAFVALLWLVSSADGRNHLRAGIWIVPTLLATLCVAYIGEYGPLTEPLLTNGLDVLLVIVIGLVTYSWAVRSGGETAELREIVHKSADEASPIHS
jgi:hypothetical protein